MAEVFPSASGQFAPYAVLVNQEDISSARDLADHGDRNTRDAGWNSVAARGSKKQFVVFAAVQCQLQIDFTRRLADAGSRDRSRLDFRAHVAFFTDVGKIGGEAVTDVDHG